MSIKLENGSEFDSKESLETAIKNKDCISCRHKDSIECECSPWVDFYVPSDIDIETLEDQETQQIQEVESKLKNTFITKEEAYTKHLVDRFNYLFEHLKQFESTLSKEDLKNEKSEFNKVFDEITTIYSEIRGYY